jgi:L-rhamnose mutarotase
LEETVLMRFPIRCPATLLLGLLVCALSSGCAPQGEKVQRFGSVIGIKKECIPEYNRLHAACWPGVLSKLRECNIRNYSIFLAEVKPDEYYLFAYYEYTGDDFNADMQKMKADPTTQEWWKHTDPLQYRLVTAGPDEWWHKLESVFYMP